MEVIKKEVVQEDRFDTRIEATIRIASELVVSKAIIDNDAACAVVGRALLEKIRDFGM